MMASLTVVLGMATGTMLLALALQVLKNDDAARAVREKSETSK